MADQDNKAVSGRDSLHDALFENALDAILIADIAGNVVAANAAAEEMFGWPRAELVGQPMDDTVIPDHHREAHRHGMARRLKITDGANLNRRVRLEALRRDGTIFPVELSLVESGSGDDRIFVGHMRDLTEPDRAEHERALEELERTRAQLTAFFDHVPVYMSLHKPSGQFVLGTRTVLESYGKTTDELQTMNPATLAQYWPRFADIATTTAKVASTGEPQRVVTPFKASPDAQERLFDVVMFPIRAADGEIVQLGSLGIDITEQRKYEEELARSRAMLQAFFENIPAMTFIISLDRHYVTANRYAVEKNGMEFLSPEHLIGQPDTINTPPEWHPVIAEAHRTVVEEGRPYVNETSITLPDGTYHLLVSRFPIRNAEGEITHVGGLLFDRTAEREAEAALAEREATLQAFFDNLPGLAFLSSNDGRIIAANSFMATEYGLENMRAEDLIGKEGRKLLPKSWAAKAQQAVDTNTQQGKSHTFDAELRLPTGTRQVTSVRFPVRNSEGEVTHVGGLVFDATERYEAQAKLAEQQANLVAFVDYAPLQVYVTDLDHKIVMVNDWVHRETGAAVFHPSNVLGLSADQMVPSNWADMSHDNDAVVVEKGGVTQVEVRGQFGGKERDIISIRFPIKNAEGEVVRIGGFVVDVTKQKSAERALKEQLAQLHQTEKLAALGQLLAGVSHELNNPLAAVIGQTSLLAEDLEGTDHADRVAKIQRAADRCAKIVQSFLAMARQKAPEHRLVSIHDLVKQALDLTEYQMRAANIALDVQLGETLPQVDADPDQLHQVIVNLLTNARQALDGAADPCITLTASAAAGEVKLRIGDNGPGIDPAVRARIFDPFYTTKEVGSGTGLGLSYSLGIVEAHGGRLELEPSEAGSVFALTLPVSETASKAEEAAAVQTSNSKGRVLVVDDEIDVAETLQDMLLRQGLEVEIAPGGTAAQTALAGDAHFDLVISDIRMPDVDGPELHAWIIEHRADLAGRIAFVTGDTMSERVADFLKQADCPVLEKPFNRAALADLIERMMP
jgi:PAS domain S-box-containing protein